MVTEMFEYMRILIVEPSGGAATSMSLGNVKIDYFFRIYYRSVIASKSC